MAVDEQQITLIIRLLCMSGQMNFANLIERKICQIGERGKAVVGGRNENIVDVEKQAAASALGELADEFRFAHRRLRKNHIG